MTEYKNKELNEQIIALLKDKKYNTVWSLLKNYGKNINSNTNLRYIIFLDCVKKYDLKKNNNFIAYYLTYLRFIKFNDDTSFYIFSPKNYRIAKKVLNERISPTEESSNYVKDLKDWSI